MEIYNNNKNTFFRKVKSKLSGKRILIIVLLFIGLIGFGFASLLYGAYLNKTGQTSIIKMFMVRTAERDLSYIPKHIKSKVSEIENISIDIKFKNWQKIKYIREKALLNGGINKQEREEVPASIRYKNKSYKAEISITGQTDEHIKHPSKWSFLIKLKNGKTINGVNKFAIIYPRARGYLTDWFAFELLKSQDLITIKSDFIDVDLNGKSLGLYYFEERFESNLLVNNNRPEGILFKLDGDLKVYQTKKIEKSKKLSSQLIQLKKILHLFLTDKISVDEAFDIDKFAALFVISDIMNQKHALFRGNTRLYYNPVTNLIEPIGREWGFLKKEVKAPVSLSIDRPHLNVSYHIDLHKDPILSKVMNSNQFKEAYIKKANIISKSNYIDSVFNSKSVEFELLMNKIYKHNPFYNFPLNLLHENQEYMRLKLHPYPVSPRLDVFFDKIKNDSIFLLIKNNTFLPINVNHFEYNKKTINLKEKILIEANYKTNDSLYKISFDLPHEINPLRFSSDSLITYYKVLGLQEQEKAIVFPKLMTDADNLKVYVTKQPSTVEHFNFLTINNKNKTIEFSNLYCKINQDLIIPKGYTLTAVPGCKIDIINSSKIISYSPILFFGKAKKPIEFLSSDATGQGIVVYNTKRTSELSFVNFKSLSNISSKEWSLNGIISFYEAPVNISNCNFSNNIKGIDYLSIVRSDFNILNTTFKNINANAFNSNFSEGKIENVIFDDVSNNAIHTIDSKLQIEKSKMININGTSITSTQNSKLICKNIIINCKKTSIVSKDNSLLQIDSIKINSDKLVYQVYQEKPGYGPAIIRVKNATVENVQAKFFVETGSILSINGNLIKQKIENVKEQLTNNENGKPTE